MPAGDRTGPNGSGPMTGRGAGYCNGYDVPGFQNNAGGRRGRSSGRGFGAGARRRRGGGGMNDRGFGRGFGRGFEGGFNRDSGRNVAPDAFNDFSYEEPEYQQNNMEPQQNNESSMQMEQAVIALKAQADYLASALKDVHQQLSDIKTTIKNTSEIEEKTDIEPTRVGKSKKK